MKSWFFLNRAPSYCKESENPDNLILQKMLRKNGIKSMESNGINRIKSNFDQVITDMSLSNPPFRLILGHFNCRSNSWWKGDISTKEGINLESVFSSHGLHQLITDPTHILPQSSSCIDLIFIDQPNLVIDSGVHFSLHVNCHHQITHCRLKLKTVFPVHMSA